VSEIATLPSRQRQPKQIESPQAALVSSITVKMQRMPACFITAAYAEFDPPPHAKYKTMSENNLPVYDLALQTEVATLIVEALNLDVAPADIGADDPLYGDGLGLDSIDVLEVALVASKRFGLQIRADNDDNHRIFSSLRSLTNYISAERTC
jgi:acyl carrier protein